MPPTSMVIIPPHSTAAKVPSTNIGNSSIAHSSSPFLLITAAQDSATKAFLREGKPVWQAKGGEMEEEPIECIKLAWKPEVSTNVS